MILADDNPAARLLSRPGEAIYNDAGGLVEGNQPFQVAWLPAIRIVKYSVRSRLATPLAELSIHLPSCSKAIGQPSGPPCSWTR